MGQAYKIDHKGWDITDITADDYEGWLALWLANNQGRCDEAVTQETWMRLNNSLYPVHGLLARKGDEIAGLLHYILHPVTGHINPVCYMQDVFVAPEHRCKGIATALIAQLAEIGKSEDWARLYWLVENNNEAAQALYKNTGLKLDFSLYVHPMK